MASQISRYRTIAAGPQAIWEVLADFGALSGWADNVDHSSVLEHGHSEGTATPIGTARRVQIGRNTLVERITAFTPSTELAYDITGLPAWVGQVSNRWKLTPTATNGTVVTLTSTVDTSRRLPRHLGRGVEHVVCRVLAKQSDAMLAGLADSVESRRG
ncbi:SRPBCC family protein [Mycolicibacterium komossense]|uniref:SRPBCC family protein n=1 Tax=Mycolicibacterium komossense TaxID=1779 RepID=A0ABT3CAQ8_9MYCO|nr:SRPBCC family protein [Mycolicibacterium komossense]MCV7226532.1 SRPBCC family protein [Mycolicibacterium komossense]